MYLIRKGESVVTKRNAYLLLSTFSAFGFWGAPRERVPISIPEAMATRNK